MISREKLQEEKLLKLQRSKRKKGESGQGLTEYVVILVIVSLSAVIATQSLGKQIKNSIRKSTERIKAKVVFEDD